MFTRLKGGLTALGVLGRNFEHPLALLLIEERDGLVQRLHGAEEPLYRALGVLGDRLHRRRTLYG